MGRVIVVRGSTMGNKILVLVIACILVFPLGLIAKDKPGADLLIVKLDGEQVRGELIAVKESSLLLLSESGADVSVDVKEMKPHPGLKPGVSALWHNLVMGFCDVGECTS